MQIPIIVQKFGGSSVADVQRLQRVADHVVATARAGKRVVVVVSAMGKTTDGLVKLAHELTEDPDRREMDMLLTAGERISMSLLAIAIRARGLPATSLTGSQCGILTNDAPGGARIVEVRPYRVQDALHQGHIVIVAGFQGVSYRREVTTLGRGGSDTTAVALAAALGAEACEIYSDVDGIYSADPHIVVAAKRLDTLDQDEMLALARAGAKVLGSDAVAYARMHGIALYARASDDRGGETIVRRNPPPDAPWLTGVAARSDCALLQFANAQQHWPVIDALLQDQQISPIALIMLENSATLLLGRDVADAVDPAFAQMLLRIEAQLANDLKVLIRGSLVSLVGPAVGRDPQLLQQFTDIVRQITFDDPRGLVAHGLTLSCFADADCVHALLVALHRRFIEAPG